MNIVQVKIAILIFLFALPCHAEKSFEGRNLIRLETGNSRVIVDRGGGSIVDFSLLSQGLNPLTFWHPERGDLKPQPIGHFVCFDRLGNSSPQEKKNGMPNHGEAGRVDWTVLSQPSNTEDGISASMYGDLPLAGMRLTRKMMLSENAPVLYVTETFTNNNKLGKVYNIVQHPTIAPPFLDDTVCVDSNALKGFWVGNPAPTYEEPLVWWPTIMYRGDQVDLRNLKDNHNPGVVNFVFPDGVEHGWVTACNARQGLLFGYLWRLTDYPWFRIWRYARGGKPQAVGLEFGTTPLPYPFGDILAKGSIFGRPIYEYLDAGQSIEKSYIAFLAEVPEGFRGVASILIQEKSIILKEKGLEKPRDITIAVDKLD
ncbi:hypothetical protein ACFL47_01010 [Candidatus Latescibacterota bacterium]